MMTTDLDCEPAAAVQAYLDAHFCDGAELAHAAGMEEADLESLVAAGTMPLPAYVVEGDTLISAAFGPLHCEGLRPGRYYRRATAAYAVRAAELPPEAFEQLLRAELADALRSAHVEIAPLPDAFEPDGSAIEPGLCERLDNMLDAYRKGVFSICIADVAAARGIVRKEILQEKLTLQTESEDVEALLADIEAYAEAAMPFSPLEYPRSSRKRLVEDLRDRLTA